MLETLCGVGFTIKVNVNRRFAWLLRYVLDFSATIFDVKVIHFLGVDCLRGVFLSAQDGPRDPSGRALQ